MFSSVSVVINIGDNQPVLDVTISRILLKNKTCTMTQLEDTI